MTAQPNASREKRDRQIVSRIFQWSGIADVVVGVVLAVLMPSLLPGDPVSVQLGVIACGVLAVLGVGVWALGRFVFGQPVMSQPLEEGDVMTAQPNAAREKRDRQKVSTILQWSGIADVVIGVVLAVLMPSLLPGDPVSVRLGVIACGVLALSGVGVWALGRFVFGQPVKGRQAGTVERRGR